MAAKKGGLGRGLDALFADAVPVYENEDAANDTFKDIDKKTLFLQSSCTSSLMMCLQSLTPRSSTDWH